VVGLFFEVSENGAIADSFFNLKLITLEIKVSGVIWQDQLCSLYRQTVSRTTN
jgi:hypothetical protein